LKFIWYLIALAAVFAALVVYQTKTPRPTEKNSAITINKKQISTTEFAARLAAVHPTERQDFVNSLIIKELLIQAAEKEGIDKDESFRRSIQDYYEQTLVKQVMDKKLASLKIAVSDTEIDHFASFQKSSITVTILRATDEQSAQKGQFITSETKTVQVHDLAGDVSYRLEVLPPGGQTVPFCSESGCDVFRLDAATPSVPETLSAENRAKIHTLLLERKKQSAVDTWIADLKAKADITITIK
jgi:hypothetical protein